MKTFIRRLTENGNVPVPVPSSQGDVDVEKNVVRDMINVHLTQALAMSQLTPYHGMERARKVLTTFHIVIPAPFLEGEHGFQVFPVRQFGNVIGMTNDGEVKTKITSPYSVFFHYRVTPFGSYRCYCKIMTATELASAVKNEENRLNEAYKPKKKVSQG